MQSSFRFNLILERKHLIYFPAFISHVYIYKLKSYGYTESLFLLMQYTFCSHIGFEFIYLNLHLFSLMDVF